MVHSALESYIYHFFVIECAAGLRFQKFIDILKSCSTISKVHTRSNKQKHTLKFSKCYVSMNYIIMLAVIAAKI